MFTPTLLELLCCPTDRARLESRNGALICTRCATAYPIHDGYAELLPRDASQFEHTTQYADDAGGHILDYREISRPLLSAQIKNNLLNDFIKFTHDDVVLDLGCGNGKFSYWNRDKVKTMLALDLAPWFADLAREKLPLLRGDLRGLPIADSTLDKIFSIDVLEHLTAPDLDRVLNEVVRVLKPHGRFFIFSNTREAATLAPLMAPQRALTRWLVTRGAVDFARDDWRKSDHVKAIRTYEELCALFQRHGFAVRKVKFWNGFFQGWIENVVVKLGESFVSRRAQGVNTLERQVNARARARAQMNGSALGKYYVPLEVMTKLMSLDLKLFGNLLAGPYFLLVEKLG
jgi:ubiquinone/menaquinone biosynthesis C-methylase UbiE/uncharacterized protein YbaR (Trm112 family)